MELQPARLRIAAGLLAAVLAAAGCSGEAEPAPAATEPPVTATEAPGAGCADVVDVGVRSEPGGTYEFEATVRSADTGWEKYADAWQVLDPDGAVLGTRELAHPHVDEQPFTRTLAGVEVPAGIVEVTVRARDSVYGWCGRELVAAIPSS